jgi:hypothetical protein
MSSFSCVVFGLLPGVRGSGPTFGRTALLQTDQLVALVRRNLSAGGRGVKFFTFGYGADHNADMLTKLAAGGGLFYSILRPEDVALSFGDCLGGLLSVVANDITLRVWGVNGASVQEVMDSKMAISRAGEDAFHISVGDMYEEERRDVLLRIKVPAGADHELLMAEVTYTDVASGTHVKIQGSLHIARLEGGKGKRKASESDPFVLTQIFRVDTAKALTDAKALADAAGLADGRALLQTLMTRMSAVELKDEADVALMAELKQDLADGITALDSNETYRKRGHSEMTANAASHYAQRSSGKSMSAYRPAKKAALVSKASKAVSHRTPTS